MRDNQNFSSRRWFWYLPFQLRKWTLISRSVLSGSSNRTLNRIGKDNDTRGCERTCTECQKHWWQGIQIRKLRRRWSAGRGCQGGYDKTWQKGWRKEGWMIAMRDLFGKRTTHHGWGTYSHQSSIELHLLILHAPFIKRQRH